MLGTNGDSLGIRQLQQRIEELEEENKTLKELNACVGCDNNPDYKSRIDKAIEYIEKILPSMDVKDIDVITLKDTFWGKDLLEILKGE